VSKASPSIGATAMEEHQYTPEALEHCRRTTGTALSAAAERVSEASEGQSIVTSFDWEIPELTTPHLNTFLARIHCQAGERSFRIPIDVARLAAEGRTADLERLHDILATRHAGLDNRYSLLQSLEWMLNISLEQAEPELSPSERQVKVHQLLFIPQTGAG